ncbi:MAG: hypothetical protein HUU54_04425 [Ignavibacteriaceae bacterium]|nr:hypothetical protein [Ignavibacteriaceae bacterium]
MSIPVECKEVMMHVCENLGEQLDSPRCVAIKEHLASCDVCRHYFESVEQTIDFYRKYEIDVPENAHHKLVSILGLEKND